MPIGSNIIAGASGQATGYDIDQSLRFDDGDTPKLIRTPSSSGSLTTWTFSAWVKRGNLGGSQYLFSTYSSGTVVSEIVFHATDNQFQWEEYDGGTTGKLRTTRVLRDVSGWYHIVCTWDTTNGTAGNRMRMWINGVEETDFELDTNPSSSASSVTNRNADTGVGCKGDGTAPLDGYLAEVHFIDGQALTPASFGENNADTNQWVPIEVTGMTYGTNGFYQKYSSTELANSFTDSSKDLPSVTYPLSCDFLVIGGGGGGGSGDRSGGGGAGGYRTSAGTSGGGASAESAISLSVGKTYTVTVGAGGAASNNGSDSSIAGSGITTITSLGGGKGGLAGSTAPSSGGSGGGGGAGSTGSGAGASGTSSQGYAGGDGASSSGGNNVSGGGGGGAGAVGVDTASDDADGGAGGVGVSSSITGSAVTRAGGGAGGAWANNGGAGGSGGGGAGGKSGVAGTAGTANTGGGGGGGGTAPGAGGSGIIIIRYASTTQIGTGGTVTSYTDSGTTYQVHTFTSSGTLSFGHTITANGTVVNTRAVTKVNSSSMYIPAGTSNNVTLPAIDFGSDDFTIEMWARDLDTSEMSIFWNNYNGSSHGLYISNIAPNLAVHCKFGGTSHNFSGTWNGNDWSHIAVVRNGSTVTLYADGSSLGTATVSGTMSSSGAITMGGTAATADAEGYFDEIRVSDTARYTGTYTPPTTAFTADSNTLLLIQPDWDGGLGADSSGNENDFSATNLVATDQVLDSPTNNFATLNPLINSSGSPAYSEGNLVITPDGSNYSVYQSTIPVSSGKWYAEYLVGDTNTFAGVSSADQSASAYGSYWDNTSADFIFLNNNNGNKIIDGAATSYVGAGATVGQIVGVAIDLDGNAINFYINNSAQGSISFSGGVASASSFVFSGVGYAADAERWNFGQDSSFAGNKTAQGNQDSNGVGDFYYEPPSGYLALCTDNLSTPEIALPGENFNILFYTGNDSNPRSFTGVGFQPDFVWSKGVSLDYSHSLYDSIRGGGANAELQSNSDAAEGGGNQDQYGYLSSFDSDGFTAASGTSANNYFNNSSYTYAAWNWKAGGTASSNTDGSITSSVSANTAAGFSIVSYTGTGSTATVGHGLSVAPEFLVVKNRTTASTSWQCGSDYLPHATPWSRYITLNSTAAETNSTQMWNDTAPTSSVFTIKDAGDVNTNTNNYIAYCFHSVEGYSKVGSYEGNGNADGSFIYLGFKPEFFLIKNVDATEAWEVWDGTREPHNKLSKKISPNTNDAEYTANTTTYAIDFLSNGVKLRTSYSAVNGSNTFLYYAVASSPFKTSNAR